MAGKNPNWRIPAKTPNEFGEIVTVGEHTTDVMSLAEGYARKLGHEMAIAIRTGCLLHDFGKISEDFQSVLFNNKTGVDHALPGAYILKNAPDCVVEAVAGHHGGLASRAALGLGFNQNNIPQGPGVDGRTPSLRNQAQYAEALKNFTTELGRDKIADAMSTVSQLDFQDRDNIQAMLRSRMELSILTDADWTASAYESDRNPEYLKPDAGIDARKSLRNLFRYRRDIMDANLSQSRNIARLRGMVWDDAVLAANKSHKITSLTAPTGSGKTLAYLSYAIRRCMADPTRKRIVIALPFLSLTDQVYGIIKNIIPSTVRDDSVSRDYSDSNLRGLCSTWNAPCVVTTMAQLFETLFSDMPAGVRRLHRLADSVLILDEIQSLPDNLMQTALCALNYLSQDYGTDIVLSTATPPDYAHVASAILPVEIIRDPDAAFKLAPPEKLKLMPGEQSLEAIARKAVKYSNACVVVNTRKNALAIYELWKAMGIKDIYFLSTDLSPDDRRDIIREITGRQAAGLPIKLAATQCVEAGVDLDFEKIFRQIAPLPNLIQTAGRQNRHRKRRRGFVGVFVLTPGPNRKDYPDSNYEKSACAALALFHANGGIISDYLMACAEYDAIRFAGDLTPEKLRDAIAAKDYREVRKNTRLIHKHGVVVVIPSERRPEIYNRVLDAALGDPRKSEAMRAIAMSAPISVQSGDIAAIRRNCAEIGILDYHTGEKIPTGVWVLLPNAAACYNRNIGLQWRNEPVAII